MKKVLVLAIVALFAMIPAARADIGFGLEGGLALAQYDDFGGDTATDPGVNIGVRAVLPVHESIAIAGKVGYATFFVSDEEYNGVDVTTTLNDLYIEVDGHYLFNEKFFGILGLGMHMYTFEVEATQEIGGTTYTTTSEQGDTKFGVNLGLGYKFSEKVSLDARYMIITDISQIRVNLAWMFR